MAIKHPPSVRDKAHNPCILREHFKILLPTTLSSKTCEFIRWGSLRNTR